MAKDDPRRDQNRVWGASMTIAAIILGVYLVSMFYINVIDGASSIGDDEQAQVQVLNQH